MRAVKRFVVVSLLRGMTTHVSTQPRNEMTKKPRDEEPRKWLAQIRNRKDEAHLEDLLEEGTAGREYHLVRRKTLSVTRKGHVHQTLFLPQTLEAGRDIAEETVPL